jgi:hypothetical protein
MQKHSYISIFLFFISNLIVAQNITHLNFWSRITVTQSLNEKIRMEVDFQHRRQNDITEHSANAFELNLLSSARVWVHYQHKKDIIFSLAPYTYYWHESVILSQKDKQKPQVQESRYSLAADLKHEVTHKLWLMDRTCLEYRDFKNKKTDFIRMRNRLAIRYDFNKKWNTTIYDEVFLNLEGTNPVSFFDHDRIALLLNYKPTKNIRMETGYMHITRLPRYSDEFLHENNFLVHLYYTIPQKNNNQQIKRTSNS